MVRPRIIPSLLVQNKGLVKTINFEDGKYIGDPINAVKIFNEKEVDELMIFDIAATALRQEPDFLMIENIAKECRMPLCYGGGIKSVEHAVKIINLGVEKVAVSSAAIEKPALLKEISNVVGRQSVVAVADVKEVGTPLNYEVFTHNGKKPSGWSPTDFALYMEELGAGEIVINSIDRDGRMTGYDLALLSKVREATNLPITALGGAGQLGDIKELFRAFGVIGAAAGSLFVFKGSYKAVLINYPNRCAIDSMLHDLQTGTSSS